MTQHCQIGIPRNPSQVSLLKLITQWAKPPVDSGTLVLLACPFHPGNPIPFHVSRLLTQVTSILARFLHLLVVGEPPFVTPFINTTIIDEHPPRSSLIPGLRYAPKVWYHKGRLVYVSWLFRSNLVPRLLQVSNSKHIKKCSPNSLRAGLGRFPRGRLSLAGLAKPKPVSCSNRGD